LSKAAVKHTSIWFFTSVHLSSGIWLAFEPFNPTCFTRSQLPSSSDPSRIAVSLQPLLIAQVAKTVLARQLALLTVRRRKRVRRLPAKLTIGLMRRPTAVLRRVQSLGQSQ